MYKECFGIYCYSITKTHFSPVLYPAGTGKSLGEVLYLGAWVDKFFNDNAGARPPSCSGVPPDFKPRIFSYARFEVLDPTQTIDHCIDNVFALIMPEFEQELDIKTLSLVLQEQYMDHIRRNNIKIMHDAKKDDILELKPNLWGIGIDLKALYNKLKKKLFRSS